MSPDRTLSWPRLRTMLRADAAASRRYQHALFGYTPTSWWLDPGFVAVALYRLTQWATARGWGFVARLLTQANAVLTGVDIQAESWVEDGMLLPSPMGVCLSGSAGRDLTMLNIAGIGSRMRADDSAAGGALSTLGHGVSMGMFSGIMKAAHIGDGASIAAGAGALFDVPAGGRAVSTVAPSAGPAPAIPVPRPVPPCDHRRWSTTWRDYMADIDRSIAEMQRFGGGATSLKLRIRVAMFSPLLALLTYRVAHWLHLNGLHAAGRALALLNQGIHKVTIAPQACLGGGVFMPHLAGTVINAVAGRNLTLYANTLCAAWSGAHAPLAESPHLGNDVRIGAHSAIIGPVDIGDGVFLAMKVNVFDTVPREQGVFSPMAMVRLDDDRPAPPHPIRPERDAHPTWPLPVLRQGDAHRRAGLRAQGYRTGFSGRLAVHLYRTSHAHHGAGHRRRARWAWLTNMYLTGANLSPMSEIGPGLRIDTPASVGFHGRAGRDLTLMAQTVVGAELTADRVAAPLCDAPWLGDGVTLHHHAVASGAIAIGHRSAIYPGCTVSIDVADDVAIIPRPVRLRPIATSQ